LAIEFVAPRLGPRFGDFADGAEARVFFAVASLRFFSLIRCAAFFEAQAFMCRLPCSSRQSAYHLPAFVRIGDLLETGLRLAALPLAVSLRMIYRVYP